MLDDEFEVDDLINVYVFHRSGFLNISFKVSNWWFKLPQLTIS